MRCCETSSFDGSRDLSTGHLVSPCACDQREASALRRNHQASSMYGIATAPFVDTARVRLLVIIALAACRTARPVDVPQSPAASSDGIVLDKEYLRNIPVPERPAYCCIDGRSDMPEAEPPLSWAIPGRYYIDGRYVRSRGWRHPLWF